VKPLITSAVIGLAVVLVLGVYLARPQGPPVAVSPSATATPSARPTSTTIATPSPAAASATQPSARYVNAAMLFSIEIPAPWRRATCGGTSLGPLDGAPFAYDTFVPVPDRDLTLGDTGGLPVDQIVVRAQANPEAMTPRQWKEAGRAGAALGEKVEDMTLAGRTALLISERDLETILVAYMGYMYAIGSEPRTRTTTAAERAAIVRSIRFLSVEEAGAAASPRPAPRSPEAVADALAEGFTKKDTAILSRVATRCLGEGGAQAGISRKGAQAFLEAIQERFGRGLTVEVRPRPVSGADAPGYFYARALWHEPGQPDRDSDLRIVVEGATAYWDSVVHYTRGRP
jgi:hypothetical protein